MREMPEAEVVHSLKGHLLARGLRSGRVSEVVVDADPSYLASRFARSLEPVATIRIDGARPDLVGLIRTGDSSLVIGFEVKPRLGDWPGGLAQAQTYQAGLHHSYLALPLSGTSNLAELGRLEKEADADGIGVLIRDGTTWREAVPPTDPRPLPWMVEAVAAVLRGVPIARRLQLNHPLNYLVVPFLRLHDPTSSLEQLLETHWPDLGSPGTRSHAIEGARHLGLIDRDGALTPEGATTADLLLALGFDPRTRPSKRVRLSEIAPPIAAVARSVLLRQPAVRLVVDALRTAPRRALPVHEVFQLARRRDLVLADALFLADPSLAQRESLRPTDYNPSTVFKFKQVLWHGGLLETKASSSAGHRATDYRPDHDLWRLEDRYFRWTIREPDPNQDHWIEPASDPYEGERRERTRAARTDSARIEPTETSRSRRTAAEGANPDAAQS
jgi:hypothetical protein